MALTGRADEDIESLKQQLAAERLAREAAEARATEAAARATSAEALIAHLRLAIEKLKRDLYGSRSEHGRKLLDQMELELEELVATPAEDTAKAELALKCEATIPAPARRHPVRKPLPEHLPRERVIAPGPTACFCCGSSKLAKLGEDVTETLEVVPRQWKVIQYVPRLSGHSDVAKAMDYMLKRIDAFTRFLDDGRICLTNNAAERSLRGIAIGRNVARPIA